MGDKVSAIEAMVKQACCVPGSMVLTADSERNIQIAKRITLAIIKAAGGGGRGMRVVRSEKELID